MCSIVPPHLLRSIADCSDNGEHCREVARRSLEHSETFCVKRQERLAALAQPRAARTAAGHPDLRKRAIVPEFLLQQIAERNDVDDETRARARRDAEHIRRVTTAYQKSLTGGDEGGSGASGEDNCKTSETPAEKGGEQKKTEEGGEEKKTEEGGKEKKTEEDKQGDEKKTEEDKQEDESAEKTKPPKKSGGFYRAVHDAQNGDDEDDLPGKLVRVEGQKPVDDEAVNDAFDNVGKVLDFYLSQFNWHSIDNRNMHVVSTVHFGKDYENAFWDPERMQMVFGDGHDFLHNFTKCVEVIGNGLTMSLFHL